MPVEGFSQCGGLCELRNANQSNGILLLKFSVEDIWVVSHSVQRLVGWKDFIEASPEALPD